MADYRDLAAALGGGYGQDTGGITPDTLATLKNKASASDLLGMLKAIGSGSLSNLESLIRGGVAQVPGAAGDIEGLARMGINKSFGAGGVNVNPTPVLPTTTDILGMMPRATATRPETAGMEEMGGYMAPATAKVMKPAAVAAGRLAGQEINAAMTGQPTRSLLGTITPKPKFLDVYHGTPHTLPPTERNPLGEFDASKIGTGEGAQVYGYGIYTAENPAVATGYRDKLQKVTYSGNEIDPANPSHVALATVEQFGDRQKASAYLKQRANLMDYEVNMQAAKLLDDGSTLPTRTATGNLYKIDLPDEMIPKMLDYDKPMSEQSLEVQKILLPYQKEIGGSFGTGEQTLKAIAFERRMKGLDDSPKAVADQLQKMGIVGVKYLDQGSRRPGVTSMTQAQLDTRIDILKKDIDSGLGNQDRMKEILSALEQERASHSNLTRNFVMFPGEEKNMTILERNAEKSAK
jgi:hypothetical protein